MNCKLLTHGTIRLFRLITWFIIPFPCVLAGPHDPHLLEAPNASWTCMENRQYDEWGHIRMHKNKWLMHFLHWRPLENSNKTITPEYAQHQLLNFWGPNMAHFTLTGQDRTTVVNGHEAYLVNGRFRDMVETRFIIWNCEETDRQFTADLNINLRVNTPEIYIGIQELMAGTVNCHGDRTPQGGSILSRHVAMPDIGISFAKPSGWRTMRFEPEAWFPTGVDHSAGSLWTLLPDAEKQIDYVWMQSGSALSNEVIGKLFAFLQDEEALRFAELFFKEKEPGPDSWLLSGHYRVLKGKRYIEQYLDFSDRYLFRGFAWKQEDVIHLLLVSIAHIESIWGFAVDLTPTKEMLNKLLILAAENMSKPIPRQIE